MRFRNSLFALIPACCALTSPILAAKTPSTDNGSTAPACSRKAALNLGGKWSVYTGASFLYWLPQEEGLTLAKSSVLTTTPTLIPSSNTEILKSSFSYQPGFKVGLGAIYNAEWLMDATYTWLHASLRTKKSAPSNDTATSGTGVWAVPSWFQQASTAVSSTTPLVGTRVESKWKIELDMLDVCGKRPFYRGQHLAIAPHAGFRAAWIRQSMQVDLTQSADSMSGDLGPQPLNSTTRSKNFGFGPSAGVQMDVLLGNGWSMTARWAGSLLGTWFNKVTHQEDAADDTESALKANNNHQFAVLPNAEMGAGLSWGTYMGKKHKAYFDLSLSYDYVVFWEQNAMRQLLDNLSSGARGSAGDLSFNGLTLSTVFHF